MLHLSTYCWYVRSLCFSLFKFGYLLYCRRFKTCCVRPRETPVAAAEDCAATYWWYVRSPSFSLFKFGSLLYCRLFKLAYYSGTQIGYNVP